MPFSLNLRPSRTRPIAPAIHIDSAGQATIQLSAYRPKTGASINFFDTALYEGVSSEYQRLGLTESPALSSQERTWTGTYNDNIRRYLLRMTGGKQQIPAVPSHLQQESHHDSKSTSSPNRSDLFTSVSHRNLPTTSTAPRGDGTTPTGESSGHRTANPNTHGSSDESANGHDTGPGIEPSRKRSLAGTFPHTQRLGEGQLSMFDQPVVVVKAPAIIEKETTIQEQVPLLNYQLDIAAPEKRLSPKDRLQRIIEAVKLLKQLEDEERLANPEEQHTLAQFTGFGAVANIAFRDTEGNFRKGYEALGQELENLLTSQELRSARRSTPNAFYTSPIVMQAMYEALSQLGVNVGVDGETIHALEPGCGCGNFMGIAPASFDFVGVEKENISARLARQLYPAHHILHKDFKDTETMLVGDAQPLLQDGAFDVVVGNIPFGKIQLPHTDGNNYRIHDYFLLKSLDKLREGGLIAVITSSFSLDKRDSTVRERLAEEADLVAAFRLPNQAFAAQGTEVLTDILILHKRSPEQAPSHTGWLNVSRVGVDKEGQLAPSSEGEIFINDYFLQHPEHILGDTLSIESGMYAQKSLRVSLEDPLSLQGKLQEAVTNLSGSLYQTRPLDTPAPLFQPKIQQQEFKQEHIREGSFVLSGRNIQQIQQGELQQVIYRNKPLTTDSKIGQRIRDYVQVRDAVKVVIDSQKAQLPLEVRDQAREALNLAYLRFVHKHGPINAVKLSEIPDTYNSGQTKISRRFVNINELRGDPDIYLVMSIEQYDEKKNRAEKGDIFHQDIIAPGQEIVADTPEEGLIASIQQFGQVDIPYIADLCACSEETVLTTLQERETPLIYFDPGEKAYTTREAYLSGNIRQKLKQLETYLIEHPADERVVLNQAALAASLPVAIPYEQVTANLGASWIDPKYVQEFAQEIFGGEWQVQFVPKNAQWLADVRGMGISNKEADPYAVDKFSGAQLFTMTLEGKSANVYKSTINEIGEEKRVINREQTLLARQNQEKIRQRFKQWVFEDEDRAEDLAQTYNATFNSVVLRKYDGQFLSFDGMASHIQLRPHQQDAIYRMMCEDSCLLAHATGAGKTFSMAAAGMNLKQMGLRQKPLYVVPNHMLEQFSREFLLLYPDANILVATKADVKKDNRKLFTAKAATNEWDAIIMTHSSFNKVGMSPEYQAAFIQQEIEDYEELLGYAHQQSGRNKRRFIKNLETSKQNLEHKLDVLVGQNARSKDQHIFFEELGVDHIFIDEAHAYKNLRIQTKMDRVAGLNTSGSERALNLYMITEYLNGQDRAGITFSTATPLTNSLAEMYSMMRYLIPQHMEEMGIKHFDAWAAAFGEVVTRLEIKPDASTIDFQSRFAKFHNVPELLQLFNRVADIKRSEDLDLPIPEAQYETIVAEPSQALIDFQGELQTRYQRVRNGQVEPKEDNALKISTEGRKAALDVRLVDTLAPDDPASKVNQLVENVYHIWEQEADSKATQMIFCDMGVHARGDSISIYQDIKDKLIARGIPPEEIANINDYNSDIKKASMFEQVRRGEVRVLIGSTQKMGTGTNVQSGTIINGKLQGGLMALHHLDAPWRPADMEQRDGRIIRQGNPFEAVNIYRYITQQSFDAVMWQKLEQKQHFISQIMSNSLTERTIDDIGSEESLAFAEVAAIASGNPEILELAEVEAEIRSLLLQEEAYQQKITRAKREYNRIPSKIKSYHDQIEGLQQLISIRDTHKQTDETGKDVFQIEIEGQSYDNRKAANPLLKQLLSNMRVQQSKPLGSIHGMSTNARRMASGDYQIQLAHSDEVDMLLSHKDLYRESIDLPRRLENLSNGLEKRIKALNSRVGEYEQQHQKLNKFLQGHEARMIASPYGAGFEEQEKLVHLQSEKQRLEALLATSENTSKDELLNAEVEDAVIIEQSVDQKRAI